MMLNRDLMVIRKPTPRETKRAFFMKEGSEESLWVLCDTPEEISICHARFEKLVQVWDAAIAVAGRVHWVNLHEMQIGILGIPEALKCLDYVRTPLKLIAAILCHLKGN